MYISLNYFTFAFPEAHVTGDEHNADLACAQIELYAVLGSVVWFGTQFFLKTKRNECVNTEGDNS